MLLVMLLVMNWVRHKALWKYDQFRSVSGTSKLSLDLTDRKGIDNPWVLTIKKIAIE